MSEIEQLKSRIAESGFVGIDTEIIIDDYEPAGGLMVRRLVDSGEFLVRKSPSSDAVWRIFTRGMEPY